MQLTLRNDSTYHYNTCGILIDGFWKKNGDSLVMSVSQIKYKHEKLKDSIPSIYKSFLVYKIEGNSLFGFVTDLEDNLRINKLTKI